MVTTGWERRRQAAAPLLFLGALSAAAARVGFDAERHSAETIMIRQGSIVTPRRNDG